MAPVPAVTAYPFPPTAAPTTTNMWKPLYELGLAFYDGTTMRMVTTTNAFQARMMMTTLYPGQTTTARFGQTTAAPWGVTTTAPFGQTTTARFGQTTTARFGTTMRAWLLQTAVDYGTVFQRARQHRSQHIEQDACAPVCDEQCAFSNPSMVGTSAYAFAR